MKEPDASLIRQEFIDRGKRAKETGEYITKEEFDSYYMNSYERNYLVQFMDTQCLLAYAKRFQENFTLPDRYPCTYEETALTVIYPELLTRLNEILNDYSATIK